LVEEIKPAQDPTPPGWMFDKTPPEPIKCYMCGTELVDAPGIGLFCPNKQCDVMDDTSGAEPEVAEPEHVMTPAEEQALEQHVAEEWEKLNVEDEHHVKESDEVVDDGTAEPETDVQETSDTGAAVDEEDDHPHSADVYVKEAERRWKAEDPARTLKTQRILYESGQIDQLPWMEPPYYTRLVPDDMEVKETKSGFGISFPTAPNKGDTYLRVDRLPSALYKFNGSNWIEVDKMSSYIYDDAYIDHLIAKISSGEYDPDLLSDAERDQIEQRLNGK